LPRFPCRRIIPALEVPLKRFRRVVLGALTGAVLVACSSAETQPPASGAGGGGSTSSAGGGGAGAGELAVADVAAPDRTRVTIELSRVPAAVPLAPDAYEVTSDRGPLVVSSVVWDGGSAVELVTEKQKLGVEYELTIREPDGELDGLGGAFIAADTATFWTANFATMGYRSLTADRLGVGEHVVVYGEQGWPVAGIAELVATFDEEIVPTETAIFRPIPDRDENGRVVLLYVDGGDYFGGYFSPINTFPEATAVQFGGHSNEAEMLYLNVLVDAEQIRRDVVAHELLHLLYQEEHPFEEEEEYFDYHNEGIAECAVHAVFGSNPLSAWYYVNDPSGQLAEGLSLVLWEYSNYSQYAQAYVFWSYVASRLGGAEKYGDLFRQDGGPGNMTSYFIGQLGQTFAEVHLAAMTAAWAQKPTGIYGFEGMLELPGKPLTAQGQGSIPMSPFAALFFAQSGDGVTPAGSGPSIRFAAVNGAGAVDSDVPLDGAGGAIVAIHAPSTFSATQPEPSGVMGAGVAPPPRPASSPAVGRDPSWLHPPPVPVNHPQLRAFRKATVGF
jgi:hypothetical protein